MSQAIGEGLPKRFTDPDDGKLDLSEWLLDHKGFLPVPIIITEPAVGYGAGVALAFFRESLRDTAERSTASGRRAPPDVFGVGALATENGTKGAALGGQWTFVDGRYLYRGGVADVSINLDFYGVGGQLPGPIDKVGYELSGFGSFQQGMVRLGDSDVYAGIRWIYLDLSASLDVAAGDIGLSPRQMAKRSSGAGVAIEHDSRDNIFTPNRGWIGAFEATFYSPEIGGSNTFQAYRAHVFDYHQLSHDWILGLRADGRLARRRSVLHAAVHRHARDSRGPLSGGQHRGARDRGALQHRRALGGRRLPRDRTRMGQPDLVRRRGQAGQRRTGIPLPDRPATGSVRRHRRREEHGRPGVLHPGRQWLAVA
ncbi:MAG: glyceraldehyde-3-phosphate dehydrogenase [Betaproteobacteria bacterium]|nr:glyceraldehyde-3-phosphate dehydrogenase [Betaproteobacteria bacterium]